MRWMSVTDNPHDVVIVVLKEWIRHGAVVGEANKAFTIRRSSGTRRF